MYTDIDLEIRPSTEVTMTSTHSRITTNTEAPAKRREHTSLLKKLGKKHSTMRDVLKQQSLANKGRKAAQSTLDDHYKSSFDMLSPSRASTFLDKME